MKKYECTFCQKSFKKNSNLYIHIRGHIGEKPFKCEICSLCYTSAATLNIHKKAHSRKDLKCLKCEKIFKRLKSLLTHQKVHKGKNLSCKLCNNKIYKSAYSLNKHIRNCHRDDLKTHKCQICDKKYKYKKDLEAHMRSHTGERPFQCNLCDKRFFIANYLKRHMFVHWPEKRFKCHKCGIGYRHNSTLVRHNRIHSGLGPITSKCEQCGKSFQNLRRHIARVHNKTQHLGQKLIECKICSKKYHTKEQLKNHLRWHRSYPCYFCKRTFTALVSLVGHIQTHTNELIWKKCNFCDKSFSKIGNLRKHVNLMHDKNKKRHQCSFCSAELASKGSLAEHMKSIHLKEKPHKCTKCGKDFSQPSLLYYHIQAIHSIDNVRDFKCTLCSSSFRFQKGLRSHMYTSHLREKKIKCYFCFKKFLAPAMMKSHLLIHFNERPCKCYFCCKWLATLDNLRFHMRVFHFKEKPIKN